jgi:hypothetical protein
MVFLNYRNRDFDAKYSPTDSLIGYPKIEILYFVFLASQDGERGWLFRVST